MDNARVSRLVALLSLMVVAVLALAACGGGLDTVPQSDVEAGQEGVGVVTDSETVTDTEAVVDADAAAEAVTEEEVATDEETVTVGAEAVAPEGSVTTTTETGTQVVTDTIVVTAVTELVTDTTIIEDVTASVAVTAEEADIDVDTSAIEADAVLTDSTVVTESTAVTGSTATTGSTDAAATSSSLVANAGVSGASNVFVTASSLRGYEFSDLNGENVGSVSNIILDPASGRILYLVVSYGGFLTLGQSEVPVPLNAFTMVDEETLAANFDQNMLEQFPVTDDNWYETGTWNDEASNFWGGMNFGEASFGDTATGVSNFVRAEDILGRQVALATEADDMSNNGNIDDLLLDLGRGYAKYLLVDVGDIEIDGLYAVPFSAFNFSQVGDVYAFNSDFDNTWLTNAPVMDRNYLMDPTVAPNWGTDNDSYWNERGFFGDWGN